MNVQTYGELAIRGSPPQPVTPAEPANPRLRGEGQTVIHLDPSGSPDRSEIEAATEGVNAFLQTTASNHVQFEVHEETGRMMVEIVDDRTDRVVRTIPAREMLDLAAKIGELVGTFLDQKG